MSYPMNGNSITQRVMIQTSIRDESQEKQRREAREADRRQVLAQAQGDKRQVAVSR